MNTEALIRDIHDFPQPGVVFKDITPLLADPAGLKAATEQMVALVPEPIDLIAGVEARGFWFAPSMALALGCGFVAIRKPAKLPGPVLRRPVSLEYGEDELAVHVGQIPAGARVLVVDDVLATGGTLLGASQLVADAGGELVTSLVYLEIGGLGGRAALTEAGLEVRAVVTT